MKCPWKIWFIRTIWIVLWLLFGLLCRSYAQHNHDDPLGVGHTHQGDVGKFYQTWQRPLLRNNEGKRYAGCCGGQDCRPVLEVRKHPGGVMLYTDAQTPATWEVYIENLSGGKSWYAVPDVLWEDMQPDPRESPDERSHVCVTYTGYVLCAVRASGQ